MIHESQVMGRSKSRRDDAQVRMAVEPKDRHSSQEEKARDRVGPTLILRVLDREANYNDTIISITWLFSPLASY
jgi:hypothetical protein